MPPPRRTADADMADDATGGREAVALRLVIDVAPKRATLHPGRASGGVDQHGPHRQRSTTSPSSHAAVPATLWLPPYGDLEVMVARETHRRDHIGHARATANVAGRRSTAPFQILRAVS